MSAYTKHFSARETPQNQPIPGGGQVPNSAGGFAFAVDNWTRLDRFLVLGAEGPTYYAGEKALTVENANAVLACLCEDGPRAVRRIVEISVQGRAPKNDPAVFALALASAHGRMRNAPMPPGSGGAPHGADVARKQQDYHRNADATRKAALDALPQVCRTGTHLFQFVEAVRHFRGMGRGLHRDLLRLCRPKSGRAREVVELPEGRRTHRYGGGASSLDELAYWAVHGWDGVGDGPHPDANLRPVWALERAKRAATPDEVVGLIRDHDLVRECIPTRFLTVKAVWEALLEKMPLGAMVRNLATMTRVGLLAPLAGAVFVVCERLGDADRIRKARLHPVALLAAQLTYAAGRSARGDSTWTPVPQVVDALDRAFYLAFQSVEPTGKRHLLALDVSGSMDGGSVAGVPNLTPRVASAALALVTAAVEPHHAFVAFTSGGWQSGEAGPGLYAGMGCHNGITPLAISPRQRLDDVCRTVAGLPMGGTDCALPMLWAEANNVPVDVFVVLTDSETWANPAIHPCQALQRYRRKTGIPAKLAVVGMVSNGFSIADPADAGTMDFVGFDTGAPAVLADFARN